MKFSAIQVKFETSKYLALKRYAAKKEVSLEQELEETLNRLYRKLVPQDVREYIEEGDEIEKTGKPKVKKRGKRTRERTESSRTVAGDPIYLREREQLVSAALLCEKSIQIQTKDLLIRFQIP